MKRVAAIVTAAVLVVALASFAFAAEKTGTIKAVDANAGTITFAPEGGGADMTLKADKGVDLSKVKADTKASVTVENDMVKEIKEVKAKKKAPVGC
jgi:carbon monoxide dehydrogenase subunit G